MKNKKIIIYYLLELILTIFIFLTIILLIMKITILNKKYIISKLEKVNYYHELYLDINFDLENYVMQSGFDNNIIKDLYTEKEIKKVINNNVDNFYKGKKIVVDTTDLKNNLDKNINNYLEEINITITDEEAINLFSKEIESIYKDRIILNEEVIKQSNNFYKLNRYINIGFISLIILNILLFVLIKIIFKKITLTIPILSTMLLLLIGYYLLFSKININSILFWNTYVSDIIKSIFRDISDILKYGSIIIIFLEIFKLFIFSKLRNKI